MNYFSNICLVYYSYYNILNTGGIIVGFDNLRRQLMFVNEKYSLRTEAYGKSLLIHQTDWEVYDEDLEILAKAAEKDRFFYEGCPLMEDGEEVSGILN